MEKELNIAAILKDKQKGTKMYLTTYGSCTFHHINDKIDNSICVERLYDNLFSEILQNGKASKQGEVILFPSKEMRSWEKFAWKKGDVLTDDETFVVFKGFSTDDYTEFSAAFEYKDDACRQDLWFVTNEFRKVSDNVAKEVIERIEEHYGGSINLETLEIEKLKPEFKDGDIVYLNTKNGLEYVFAYDANKEMITSYIVAYCITLEEFAHIETQYICRDNMINSIHLATDSEKQQLFDALAKRNKAWDKVKKAIVDLPKKCEFKQMDLCLMRRYSCTWELCQFAYQETNGNRCYHTINGAIFHDCIPYNKSTKHLLGTTDEWKGGEG